MDRILYKEADGDLTCRARDFDKVFPTLYAYEETGLTPDQAKALNDNLDAMTALAQDLSDQLAQVKKERDALLKELHDRATCGACKHDDLRHDEDPCCGCIYTGGKEDNWEWSGAKDTNIPTKKEV